VHVENPRRKPRRIPQQLIQTPEDAIAALPRVCDIGCKKDSQSFPHTWIGWKCHIDWADGGVPLLAVTTSASLNDNQVAIPMMKITAKRALSFYDLMDSGYDVLEIRQVSRELGHVPIIQPVSRHKNPENWEPDRIRRYQERTTAERGNARLKDEFGASHLRVRGHAKTHMHLMFGLLALFADALWRIGSS
jgi:Transposase DDE domain